MDWKEVKAKLEEDFYPNFMDEEESFQEAPAEIAATEEDDLFLRIYMDIEKLTAYCLSKPCAFMDYPFGPEPSVIKMGSKMFCYC